MSWRAPARRYPVLAIRDFRLLLVEQAEQQVLAADVIVAEHLGLFLGRYNHAPRMFGEPLEHPVSPLVRVVAASARC